MLLALVIIAPACGGSTSSPETTCGEGTRLVGSRCVVQTDGLADSGGGGSGDAPSSEDGWFSESDTSDLGPEATPAADAATDAAPTDAKSDDSDATAPLCDPAASFGAPQPLQWENPPTHPAFPSLTLDELTLYFSDDTGIMVATRSSRIAPFGTATPVEGLYDQSVPRFSPSISANELSLVFAANSPIDLQIVHRASASGAFAASTLIAAPQAPDGGPSYWFKGFLTSDASAIYADLHSDGEDIYRVTSFDSGQAAYGALSELNATHTSACPAVTPDELVICYTSTTTGVMRLAQATRRSRSEAFGSFTYLTDLADATPTNRLYAGWISPDRCRLYYTLITLSTTGIYIMERAQ